MNICPSPTGIGVLVGGAVALKDLSDREFEQIRDLLWRYRVVVFQSQDLDDQSIQEIALRFGPLFVPDPRNQSLGSEHAAGSVVVIGNQAQEYPNAYLGHQEVLPHSDHQWLEFPSSISMLHALDAAENSAPTTWTNLVEAYDLLDAATKDLIRDLHLITYNPFFRPFGTVTSGYVDRARDTPPGPTYPHPLVRTHAVTGEKILYLNIAYEVELVELSAVEGSALVAKLQDHLWSLQAKFTHHWRRGDLVIWDNRATLHYRPQFEKSVRRILKRVSVVGERPF